MTEYILVGLIVLAAVGVSVCGFVYVDRKSAEYEARCVQRGGHLGLSDDLPACVDGEGVVVE